MQPPPVEDLSVPSELTIGQCATLACTWEVATPKPGNVHRGADFEDMTFLDFLTSAVAIGPALERAVETGLGQTVLAAVEATHQWVGTNTNLGTILLLAPLAKVPREQSLQAGIGDVLAQLNAEDAHQVYQAIRIANPGGLGQVAEMDVGQEAPPDLRAAMRVAADTDLVARQYANDYEIAKLIPEDPNMTLDKAFEMDPELQKVLYQSTFQSFNNIVNLAIEEKVDSVVIAGDIYDSEHASLQAQMSFRDNLNRLDEAGIRAFIAYRTEYSIPRSQGAVSDCQVYIGTGSCRLSCKGRYSYPTIESKRSSRNGSCSWDHRDGTRRRDNNFSATPLDSSCRGGVSRTNNSRHCCRTGGKVASQGHSIITD